MAEPRTVEGRAALSGMRPHLRRAFGRIIVAIEDEAAAPYADALREADAVLQALAAMDVTRSGDDAARRDLVRRAEAVHQIVERLAAEAGPEDRS